MASPKQGDDFPSDATDLLALTYHGDIELLKNPKIYRGTEKESQAIESRRILFYNLPSSITALQVARAAAAFGQVLLVNPVVPMLRGTDDGSMTMLVEFATSKSSEMCRLTVNSTCPAFISYTGDLYAAGVWVVPTPSFPVCFDTNISLKRGYTRTIAISPISVDCVWFMICAVAAPREVLDAEYDGATRTLTLEFAGVDIAHRTAMNVISGLFEFIFENEAANKRVDQCADRVGYGGYVAYVPPHYLQQQFDRPPFNDYWPETYFYVMTERNLHPRTNHKKRNISTSEGTTTDDDANETWSSAATSLDEESRGRALQKGDGSRSKKLKQQAKELLASVDDAQIPGRWDDFFQNRHTISLRGWDEYGKIAQHRRELSTEQGLADGTVPKCEGTCDLDCKDIKETPRPSEVDKFLAMSQEDLLIDL